MGIELSLDSPRQEGRLARTGSRDSTPILPAPPDRIRDPGDFAAIFQNRSASIPQPDPVAAAPVPRADTTEAEESAEDAGSLVEWSETEVEADTHAAPEMQIAEVPQNAAEPVFAAPAMAIAAVPASLPATEMSRGRAEVTAPFSARANGQETTAQTAPQQVQPGHGPAALMALHGVMEAKPDTVAAGDIQNQAAPNPVASSATVANQAAHAAIAGLLPPTVTKSLPRPVASAPTSAAAARFSAALTDGTTEPPIDARQSHRLLQAPLLQPLPRPEPVAPSGEWTTSAGATHTTAKEGPGLPLVSTTTAAPVPTQPFVTPQFLALEPRPAEPTGQQPGERRLASHIGTQLLQAATTSGPNTELQLNPVELGRVRLNLQAIDSTITVTIMAERPETADLMRRHVDTLAQEFRALGYQDVNVSVGQRQAGGGQSAPDALPTELRPDAEPTADQSIPQSPPNRPGLSASGSLDLRL